MHACVYFTNVYIMPMFESMSIKFDRLLEEPHFKLLNRRLEVENAALS